MAGSGDGKRRRDKRDRRRRAALWHPLRRRIARLLLDGREADPNEIAAELDEDPGKVLYHLRVLLRHRALRAKARGRAAPALYRWARAQWAQKMLSEGGESGRPRP